MTAEERHDLITYLTNKTLGRVGQTAYDSSMPANIYGILQEMPDRYITWLVECERAYINIQEL